MLQLAGRPPTYCLMIVNFIYSMTNREKIGSLTTVCYRQSLRQPETTDRETWSTRIHEEREEAFVNPTGNGGRIKRHISK
jgi:hypothetical protein